MERPDGQWSVMLVNRDHDSDHAVKVAFADSEAKQSRHFSGQVDQITFGAAEYQWHVDETGGGGHADPDGPPSISRATGN